MLPPLGQRAITTSDEARFAILAQDMLEQVRTLEEFNAYVERAGRPVLVLNGRTWERIQGLARPPVRVLESMSVRGQAMLIMRADGGGAG